MILIGLIALLHGYILWLEMFAWTTRAPKIFTSIPKEMFEPTRALAANQGLYNGFLCAGLVWSLFVRDAVWAENIATFFLACVAIAGMYGAATASRKIFFVQTLPALITLVLLLLL
jgi:putative membrane protein